MVPVPFRALTRCLCRCLQLRSEAAQAVSSPLLFHPRSGAVFSWGMWEAWLELGIAACWLWEFKQLSWLSEVWAASRELFEQEPALASAVLPGLLPRPQLPLHSSIEYFLRSWLPGSSAKLWCRASMATVLA